ncbi:MAG: 2-oxoacid:acceptor oxidoreductase family protein [Hyphomicrobiales bacterium]
MNDNSLEVPAAQARDAFVTDRPTNILIVGVGGQGVIMISKVLALLSQMHGAEVKQSEVHGMAKRGGVVFSHVRYGKKVWSPTIAKGEADVLIALEWAEGLRWLDFLKPGSGVFISDTRKIVPPFACRNRKFGADKAYAKETPAEIVSRVGNGYVLDATGAAEDLGNARAANTVLLGALSMSLPFPEAEWLNVIAQFVPKGTEEANARAFRHGREWVERARLDPDFGLADANAYQVPVLLPGEVDVKLEINEAWCKGCDICVKLCPERCLALSERHVAMLKNPAACTGCHVCEWLCPDFAIRVTRTAAAEAAE